MARQIAGIEPLDPEALSRPDIELFYRAGGVRLADGGATRNGFEGRQAATRKAGLRAYRPSRPLIGR
jgi:hypothetical protein